MGRLTRVAAVCIGGAVAVAACGRSGLDLDDLGSTSATGGNGGGTTTSTSTTSTSTITTSTTTTTTTTTTSTTTTSGGCDQDKDGFDADSPGCNGIDCNDFNPNVHPGIPENCTDGADNDCNGVEDCFDPACQGGVDCGCQPSPGGESCNNGKDDDCDEIVDCFDSDCIGTPACGCAPSETGACVDGFDNDCDGTFDCDDSDCFADPTCQCQSFPEDCGNGEDDDCDLLVDCADPQCAGTGFCKCQPPGIPEICNDGFDNDCDGLVDCADPECLVTASCQQCTAEICDDGKDNNCDNKIDCADPACFFAPNCAPTPEICNNGLDDDNDTFIDCADPDCANNPLCVVEQSNCQTAKLIPGSGSYFGDTTGHIGENKGTCGGDAGEAVFYFVLTQPSSVSLDTIGTSFDSTLYVRAGACESGKEMGCDDDSGGSWAALLEFGFSSIGQTPKKILLPGTYFVFVDGYTVDINQGPNEGPFQLNVTITPNPPEFCSDAFDNDGDIYVDCADSDCWGSGFCATCFNGGHGQPEFGPAACTDGLDNDCDGVADCADSDCHASDYYVTECCDADDDNGNGILDDFSCRCHSDADCESGQICYTHTAFACGPPCSQFFGDVCPFVAAGSFCNQATQQCEF